MEHTITVTYEDEDEAGDIEEEVTLIVPSSNVIIDPPAAAPGEEITLEITGMPIIRLVEEVVIDGADRLRVSYTTDREGNVTVEGIIVPFADPGFFPVRITVGGRHRRCFSWKSWLRPMCAEPPARCPNP